MQSERSIGTPGDALSTELSTHSVDKESWVSDHPGGRLSVGGGADKLTLEGWANCR